MLIRNLEKAQKLAPCIIYIDEFDGMAAKRGSSSHGLCVNQLLSELDGFVNILLLSFLPTWFNAY